MVWTKTTRKRTIAWLMVASVKRALTTERKAMSSQDGYQPDSEKVSVGFDGEH